MNGPRSLSAATIAVTGLHRGESPQPGGAVVSSLRRLAPEIRVLGLCYDPMESGIFSPGLDRIDRAFLAPYPKAGAKALLERLDEILAQEQIDLLIPCLDSEIDNYIALGPDLAERSIRLCLPTLQAFEDRDKTNIYELCEEIGIPAPATFQASDAAGLAGYAGKTGFPCYVKGQLYGAHKVNSVAEIYSAFNEIHSVWGGPVLLQESIAGEEYNFVGLGDGAGGIVGHCTVRKLLRTKLGKGFGGVVVENPKIVAAAERIIGRLCWNGPFELEFLKAPGRDYALFEMNPRFPAWVDFPSQLGCNLPVRMIEAALELPATPLTHCPAGRMFLRHVTDLVADIAEIAWIGTHGTTAASPEPAE